MRIPGILAAALLAAATPAYAADIPAPSTLDAVTVFPSGAEVTRVVKVKLEAGEHALLVNDVTGSAILPSVRVEATGTGKLEIGSVNASQVYLASTDPAVAQSARKKLEDEIEALSDQRAAEDNAIKAAELQQSYLLNLIKLPEALSNPGTQAPREDWQALSGVIGKGMSETAAAITGAKLKQRQLDRAIADLRTKLDAAGGKVESRTQVRIFVSAAAPLEAELRLRYQVEGASWSAFYDARLATGDQDKGVNPSLALVRRASISQHTGEDWDGVTLALSTTRPSRATAARQPEMLSIDFAPEAAARTRAPMSQKLSRESVEMAPAAPVPAVEKPGAVTEASPFQTVYAIPGRIAIKATGETKRLQLASDTFDPSLLVLTVPRIDLTAYLYARMKLPKTSQPLLTGPVALFRDGVFTGNGQIAQLVPGEEYELGFGADERVKVKQAVTDDKKGETGTFTTSNMEERHYGISVRNLHARPIQLHVLDRIPVAMHQDIKVEFSMDKGPQPSAKDVNGRRGVMLWVMKTEADEEKQLAFGYRITSPASKPITYQEQGAWHPGKLEEFNFNASTRF
jgi:uncharacterized protein (TIGR02231 family)